MVSLAELKTGKEKLELINQILLRIDTIARALDNTRLDEIVGLKENVTSLHEQTLKLKQEVLTMHTGISENKQDLDTKFESINEKYTLMQEQFIFIEKAYNDFNASREDLEAIKAFIEENKPIFEDLKEDLTKYESMKIDLEKINNEIIQSANLTKEYFELSTKIKDEILKELDHALDIVGSLHINVEELRAIKPELLQIKSEVKELSKYAVNVVSEASEVLKNKINTIFFENQRLNQEMIDSVKKLEEIKYDVGIKYKEIIQAYELLVETKESLEELKEVIALYKEFENDIKSYSELIKNFKEQIANLESDLENKAQDINDNLEAKKEQIISSIEIAKNEAIVKFDELVAKCEGYKLHFEQSYDKFNQRALIANEDLGRLAEVAKKELGNDKLIYETELKAIRDEVLGIKNDCLEKVDTKISTLLETLLEKEEEFNQHVSTSKNLIDNLTSIFNTNYQAKKNELNLLVTENMRNMYESKEEYIQELEAKTQLCKNELETKKDECLEEIDAKAVEYDIVNIKEDVANLKPRVEALEFDKTNKDAKIDILENATNANAQKIEQTKEELKTKENSGTAANLDNALKQELATLINKKENTGVAKSLTDALKTELTNLINAKEAKGTAANLDKALEAKLTNLISAKEAKLTLSTTNSGYYKTTTFYINGKSCGSITYSTYKPESSSGNNF
ncbi:hypothetical protein [Campylobacter armoricus]|uniref:Uncharacterized protein n=1 Tax=Campylobacter armoricus TaxID=2505970 RepID=A0A7L5HX43_9BACT|nr:hypothetical protein [Campylobacter armoricus]QKF79566.1 hypothetical protein CARM_0648 [Campylobacter armoricus]